jgi:hypothetical protein
MLLTLLLLSTPWCATFAAGDREVQPNIVVAQSGGKSLNQAVEQVRRQYGGRIVSAETRMEGNREMHYIRVLVDGTVKTVKVPGRTRNG